MQLELRTLLQPLRRHLLLNTLRAVPMLATVTPDQLYRVVDRFELETFAQGDVIIKQGSLGRKFYVLLTGLLDIYVDGELEDRLGSHCYFGAHALPPVLCLDRQGSAGDPRPHVAALHTAHAPHPTSSTAAVKRLRRVSVRAARATQSPFFPLSNLDAHTRGV